MYTQEMIALSSHCSLISHFTIASDGREYLRVKSVKLDDAGGLGYSVQNARQGWDATTVSASERRYPMPQNKAQTPDYIALPASVLLVQDTETSLRYEDA